MRARPRGARLTARARLALLFAALLALLGAPARAQDWEWAEGQLVDDIRWTGLVSLNPTDATSLLATKVRQPFSAETLSQDVARLYRTGRFGSLDAQDSPIRVEVSRSQAGTGVTIEFLVVERIAIRRVIVPEEAKELLDEIDQVVTVRPGGLYDPFVVARDGRALAQKLQGKGYIFAEVGHEAVPRESGVDVVFTVHIGPKVHVDEIEFEGAEQLDLDELLDAKGPDALETKERLLFGFYEEGSFDADAFRRDMERVARYYRSQGFLDARVYQKEQLLDAEGEALTLVVAVEEGPRYRVRRVGIEGARILSEERLNREIGLRPGRPFLGSDLRDAIDRIKRLYGQRSYVHCEVDVDVTYDHERALLDVTLHVVEGPKVRIEEILVEGNDKTREQVIRRELSFYPGEYVDGEEIEASLARLGRLRYFQDVRLDFRPGSERGREQLVLQVEEGRTGSFVVGGGYSTSAGFFGNISLSQNNFDLFSPPTSIRDILEGRAFSGGGQRLAITFQPGRERSQITVEFTEPWLAGYPVILGVEAFLRDRLREDWLESRIGARITLGYRLLPDLLFQLAYRIERVRVADIEFDAVSDVIRVAGDNVISALRGELRLDKSRVDRYQVVHGGFTIGTYYEYVGGPLGGDHHFQRAGASFSTHHTVLSWPRDLKWVLGFNAEVDWERPQDGNDQEDEVPIFERFFAGGQGSIRGFEFRTVTPQERDKPLGGDWRVVGTVDFSFPLFQDILRGVVFVDAGCVTEKIRGFGLDDIRVAAGFGFRVKVPLFPAPVALDFAWPIVELDDDDSQVFSFAVGFQF